MYFSRATILFAVFGLACAQESSSTASESIAATEPTLSSAVLGSVATSQPTPMAGMVMTHVVQVGGPNGSLTFSPSNVVAQPGDLVQFQFHPKNHSVVQSTFDNPCTPIQNVMANKTDAFFSGFMPTNASLTATSQVLTYTIRVADEKPVWFYCSQGQHCQAGMVGVCNHSPTSGNKTMAAFVALAAQATENLSPGQAAGSGGAAGNTPTSPSAGGGANSGTDSTSGEGASGSASGAPAEATANVAAGGFSAQSFVGAAVAVAAAVVGVL